MKRLRLLTILLAISSSTLYCQNDFDKKIFYQVLSKNNVNEINEQLQKLKVLTKYSAHEGALEMKKSGLVNNSSEKISLFKNGKNKLETALKNDSNSTELRFLRLIIQENSPKILHYDQNISQDALYLRANYAKLSPQVQQALYNYSKKSSKLNPQDFKQLKHD